MTCGNDKTNTCGKEWSHPMEITISGDFIKLDAFLKLTGEVESGGQAKLLCQNGEVSVNGERCLQRGRKLHRGDTVTLFAKTFTVA